MYSATIRLKKAKANLVFLKANDLKSTDRQYFLKTKKAKWQS